MSEEYPQLYGWLQIPDTQIDMPVMRTENDRDFYLHHDFSGTESAEGALFVDAESSIYPQDDNTVIYGHIFQFCEENINVIFHIRGK